MKRRGEPDADWTAKRKAPGRRDRRGHHGSEDRDPRNRRKPNAKIRSSTQWEGRRKGARRQSIPRSSKADRAQGRSRPMGGTKMSDTSSSTTAAPKTTPQAAPVVLTQQQMQVAQVQAMLRAPVPRIYANGLATVSTPSDVSLIFLQHGAPSGILSMSYATAKTLVKDLGNAIQTFETNSNQKVKDISDAAAELAKNAKK